MPVPPRSRLRSQIAAGAALILSIVVAPPIAAAATPAQDPTALITHVGTQGIQSLGAMSSAERIARLGGLFQQDFDINGIGLFALGRYRLAATPAEQQEFFRLYPEFTVRAFNARLDDYLCGAGATGWSAQCLSRRRQCQRSQSDLDCCSLSSRDWRERQTNWLCGRRV